MMKVNSAKLRSSTRERRERQVQGARDRGPHGTGKRGVEKDNTDTNRDREGDPEGRKLGWGTQECRANQSKSNRGRQSQERLRSVRHRDTEEERREEEKTAEVDTG